MLSSPFLKSLYLPLAKIDRNLYPLYLPIFQCNFENSWRLDFQTPVTFFVGENGTGKSTLLEAIGAKCGFNLQGGNKNHLYAQEVNPPDTHQLANQLRIGWLPKVNKGFFFRTESFFIHLRTKMLLALLLMVENLCSNHMGNHFYRFFVTSLAIFNAKYTCLMNRKQPFLLNTSYYF